VESVKAAGDLITPISGEVVEANDSLVEDPSAVNSGPEAEGK
jgi:glycine cleavage system H protein